METLFGNVSSQGWKIKGLLLGDVGTADTPEQGKVICTDDLYLNVPAGKKVYLTLGSTTAEAEVKGHTHPDTVYNATSMTVNTGTLNSGTYSSLSLADSNVVDITETTGANPILVNIAFSGVTTFNQILAYCRYAGGSSHSVAIELYNKDTTLWDIVSTISNTSAYVWVSIPIYASSQYINAGGVNLRFRHVENGVATHHLYLDFLTIRQASFGGGGATEHGSLIGLEHDDHPQYHTDARGDLRYQPLNAILTSAAGLTYASTSFVKMTGANTFSLDTNTYSLSGHDHAGVYEPAGTVSTHAAVRTNIHGLTVAAGKTLTANNTLTLAGTDGSTLTIGGGGTLGTAAYTASTAYVAAASYTAADVLSKILTVDGAASGLDSQYLQGAEPSETSTASSIVKRTSNGYIYGSYFNQGSGVENTGAANYFYDTGDGFLRKKALANVQDEICTQAQVVSVLAGGTISGNLTLTGNLYPNGVIILDASSYGASVPGSGVAGQIYFKTS